MELNTRVLSSGQAGQSSGILSLEFFFPKIASRIYR